MVGVAAIIEIQGHKPEKNFPPRSEDKQKQSVLYEEGNLKPQKLYDNITSMG